MPKPAPKLAYKTRRRWSLIVLLIGLPIYILVAMEVFVRTTLESDTGRLAVGWEVLLIAAIGVLWAIPLKFIFIGVGQADPDE